MTHLAHLITDPTPALILFGNDQSGHPHAAWFTNDELVAAERASGPLGYVALRVTNEEEQSLALQLPRGHLAHDGTVEVPRLSPELLRALRDLVLRDQRASSADQKVEGPAPPLPLAKGLVPLAS